MMVKTVMVWGIGIAALTFLHPFLNAQAVEPQTRTFSFTYAATLTQLPKDKTVHLWIPLPQTTPDQVITIEQQSVPGNPQIGVDKVYNNKILYTAAKPDNEGKLTVSLTFKVN